MAADHGPCLCPQHDGRRRCRPDFWISWRRWGWPRTPLSFGRLIMAMPWPATVVALTRALSHRGSGAVPLAIRYPGHIAPGQVTEQLVCSTDLAPTILELAGTAFLNRVDGQSLVPFPVPDAGNANVPWRDNPDGADLCTASASSIWDGR
ncbi:MAG: hypothetical protein R2867_40685 [Caldilineaceae bacterium]